MSSLGYGGAFNWAKSLGLSHQRNRFGASASQSRASGVISFGRCRGRMRFSSLIFRYFLALILIFTVFVNLTFIMESTKKTRSSDSRGVVDGGDDDGEDDVDEDDDDERLLNSVERQRRAFHRTINLRVVSSKARVELSIGGLTVIEDSKNRGIHVAVLHQATGVLMAHRFYDTYSAHEDEALILFLNMISPGRVLVFAILDEGSFQLQKPAKDLLKEQYGSKQSLSLGWRDTWALVTVKTPSFASSIAPISESLSKSPSLSEWAEAVILDIPLPLVNQSMADCDLWPKNPENRRRSDFCDRMEGYGSVCSCADPAPISFAPDPISDPAVARRMVGIPIVVIAASRPHYLYRMLRALLSASGVDSSKIVVFIDGNFEEPKRVATLFGITAINMTPEGEKNGRVAHHYKSSLSSIFAMYPKTNYTIILEEDLDVSPDIMYYFGQLLPIYESDPTVYCISAWNDHGYEHSCGDPALVMRVETMPGLGWVLKRTLFETELLPNWPSSDKRWDWDMWMRLPSMRKGRECLYPDVSRTYHFGASGLNMNPYFQEVYFKKHSLNTLPHIVLNDLDKLESVAYEAHLKLLLSQAVPIDPSTAFSDPCAALNLDNLFPAHPPPPPPRLKSPSVLSQKGFHPPRVLYISMKDESDFETWNSVSTCLHIWDLDVRGVHKSSWRLLIRSTPFFIVGAPASPYAVYKPENIKPLFIPRPTKAN